MPPILVQPQQLRQKAELLRAHAQKIDQALLTIDRTLTSLKGNDFLGMRADAVQTRYAPQKEALLQAKQSVVRFSDELEQVATRFSSADRNNDVHKKIFDKNQSEVPTTLTEYMELFHLYQGDTEWCSTYAQLMLLHAMGIDVDYEDLKGWEKALAMGDYTYFLDKYGIETEGVLNIKDVFGKSEGGLDWIETSLDQNKGILLQVHSNVLWGKGEASMKDAHYVLVTGVEYDEDGNVSGYKILDSGSENLINYTVSVEQLESAWKGRARITKDPVI